VSELGCRKTVWITGASSGIGYALALLLANKGYIVIATARDVDALKLLASKSDNVIPLSADLTNSNDVSYIKYYFELQNKAIDIVIVNAGTCIYMDDTELNIESMMSVFKINVFAAANTIDIAMPYLKKSRHRGHIIGVSSMSVYLPFSRAEYYGASKAALTYYLKSLAIDIKSKNIDVSVVYPGFIDTPLTQKNNFPMPFLISADAAAKAISCVIKKRPKEAAFPKPLHYLLRILSITPWLWRKLHKASTTSQ
jgi:short-subunit dehydrogenase